MKILLSDIPLSSENKFGPFKRVGSTFPPVNLLYLGTQLKRYNYEVRITTDGCSFDEVKELILDFKPHIIGLTFMTIGVANLKRFIEMILEVSPKSILVAGGYHSSLFPEEILTQYPKISVVFKGEAELTIIKFAELCRDGFPTSSELKEIPGIVFRDHGGEIVPTGDAPMIKNLDDLPFPDLSLIPDFFKKFHPAINRHYLAAPQALLLSGRGCPFDCYFCGRKILGRTIRKHSVEYLIELIKYYKHQYNVRSIVYGDEFLTFNRKHTYHFCEELHKNDLTDIHWCCSGRADNMDYEFAKNLRKAGCKQIGYGCESGSQMILDNINKKVTVDRMSHAVREASKAGLQVFGNFMLGCPGETLDTIEETYSFIMSNPIGFIVICFFTPLPGSHFWENREYLKYGSIVSDDPLSFNLFSGIPFVPHGLSEKVLRESRNRIYKDFYLNPARILKELKYITNKNSWRFLARVLGVSH